MPPIRTILIDDSPEFLDSAVRFLSADPQLGIVGRALSGGEALTQVAQLHPDLVLLDFAMPEMNGLEVTRQIKTQPGAPRVIILTLHDNPEYRAAAQALGADGFVAKSEFGVQLLPLIHSLFAQPVGGAPLEQLRMKNILVVDDSVTMRRMVIASLREIKDANFIEAASGLEAIERLALGPIDLMLLDLNMPDMHGVEVLRFVRAHHAYRDIPIIILTTRGDDASRAAALDAGASLYLTKPFQPHTLAAHAKELMTK